MIQTTIFDMLYPKYKIDKPIRLIEMFAGYGSQALALKYLGVPFEHHKICEWAVKSIQAYKDIHFTEDDFDYSKNYTLEELINRLYNVGISSNYNEPMTLEQIKRLNESQIRTIYNNIKTTHNLVNVQQVKGKDLEITDTDKYCYIFTYSFPCQDLSLAGSRKLMSDTSTRSGMLWEIERILDECKESGTLPQILLMENVVQVHGEGAVDDFNKWQLKLESLGYKNYWEDLIATDYGIPQTRNRCFMVSILGDYSYSFPPKQELKLKLKDLLENNVDEKYFLSDAMIKYVSSRMPTGDNKITTGINMGNRESFNKAGTLTTGEGSKASSNYIIENNDYDYSKKEGRIINKHLRETLEQADKEIKDGSYIDAFNRTIRDDELAGTISTRVNANNDNYIAIKNATQQGYLLATDGDGVDISGRMQYHRDTVQKEKAQSLTTQCGSDNGVVVDTLKRDLCNKLIQEGAVEEYDVVKHSYTQQIIDGNKKCVEKNDGNMITLTTRGDCVGVVVNPLKGISGKSWQFEQQVYDENGSARTLKASEGSGNIPKVVTLGNYHKSNHNASRIVDNNFSAPTVMENHGTITATQISNLRIRKLTPKECFRLMGVKDEDYEKVAKNQSNASLYHLAGDSIVVNVLMAIFKELL